MRNRSPPDQSDVDEEDLPEPIDADDIPDTEELPGVEKIGENRYVIRTGGNSGGG